MLSGVIRVFNHDMNTIILDISTVSVALEELYAINCTPHLIFHVFNLIHHC